MSELPSSGVLGPQEPGQGPAVWSLGAEMLGRSDYVRLVYECGLPEAEARELVGLVVRAVTPAQRGAPLTMTLGIVAPTAVVGPAPAAAAEPPPPLWRAIGPEAKLGQQAPRRSVPAWLAQGGRLSRLGSTGNKLPEPAPLLPAARLGCVLRQHLRVWQRGTRLDERRLVEDLSSCRPLFELPREPIQVWSQRLQVYWDRARAVALAWRDQSRVVRWLERWRGPQGFELVFPDASGGRRVLVRGAWRRFVPPDTKTTVLALTDLGAADEDPRRLTFWRAIAHEAEQCGARAVALVLCPARRWSRQLDRGWHALEWQRARPFRRTAPGALQSREVQRELELRNQLLFLLAPALRIEPALLRALRQRFDRYGADFGTELDVWLDERMAHRSRDGIALEPRERAALRPKFLAQSAELRQDAEALLSTHHEPLSPLILAEELLGCGSESGRQRALAVLASYARRLEARGVGSTSEGLFIERLSDRQPMEAWLDAELAAVWALTYRNADRTGFTESLPEGLSLSQVVCYLDASPAQRWARIWQLGSELCFCPIVTTSEPLPRGAGSHVADVPLCHGQVQVRWLSAASDAAAEPETVRASRSTAGDPPERSATLLDVDRRPCLRLPQGPGAAPRLLLETDQALLRIEPELCPDLATRIFRNRAGFWIEATGTELLWHQAEVEAAAREAPGLVKKLLGARPATSRRPSVARIERIERAERVLWPTWAQEAIRDHHGQAVTLRLGRRVAMRMRWIPAGRFLMGSPEDEEGRHAREGPQHWVTVTRGFWLGEVPCTQAEWEAVMGKNPSRFKGGKRPVEQVSWEDCQEFCVRLSERIPGLVARLPTEAEWEYACRAGTKSAHNDGSACTVPQGHDPALERLGWFDKNSRGETHPVGEKLANGWGLHDMHGNVWEWCSDWVGEYPSEEQTDPRGPGEGQRRVIRGGSWTNWARLCRSAYRSGSEPGYRWLNQGLRLLAVQASDGGERSDREWEEEASSGRAGEAERSRRGRGEADGGTGGQSL